MQAPPAAEKSVPTEAQEPSLPYMSKRMADVTRHFPNAMAVDDFLMRVEMALSAHGFRGDNSIACTNLCRDESTGILKNKIDAIWGASFNTNGLGACLTCGCLGLRAGFSHAPNNSDGKERYVFVSAPHIAISSAGKLGAIHRPGRAGDSYACGALIAALQTFRLNIATMTQYTDSTHDPTDVEFSILKQRLAARIEAEGLDVYKMDLVDMTALAERTITADLEALIAGTVDTASANYAVVTGVHVHNWGAEGSGEPTLEWIAPGSVYVVVDGERHDISLEAIPALTPRQLALLQDARQPRDTLSAFVGSTTVVETRHKDPAAGPHQGL